MQRWTGTSPKTASTAALSALPPSSDEDALVAVQTTVDEVREQLDADALVLRRAVPQPQRDLHAVGRDAQGDDAAAALQLEAVEHQRRQPDVLKRTGHQRTQMLTGPADKLAADRRLRRRTLSVDDVLTDRLTRPDEAARAHPGEHLLEHDLRQRITIGEVRIGRHLDLTAAIGRAHPRTLHGHPPAAERDAAVLVAVTHRDTLGIVAALGTDDVIDLLGHQLGQHSKPDTDAQRQQPFLRRAGKLPERELHPFGQRVELRVADLVGSFVYGPHGGSPRLLDLFALATVPAGPDEARRTATSSSTSYGTTSHERRDDV
jgi:hypothetical protein